MFSNMSLIIAEFRNEYRKQGSKNKTSFGTYFRSSDARRSDHSSICDDVGFFGV